MRISWWWLTMPPNTLRPSTSKMPPLKTSTFHPYQSHFQMYQRRDSLTRSDGPPRLSRCFRPWRCPSPALQFCITWLQSSLHCADGCIRDSLGCCGLPNLQQRGTPDIVHQADVNPCWTKVCCYREGSCGQQIGHHRLQVLSYRMKFHTSKFTLTPPQWTAKVENSPKEPTAYSWPRITHPAAEHFPYSPSLFPLSHEQIIKEC